MTKEFQLSGRRKLIRGIMRPSFRFVFHLLAKVTINGREHIPKSGPYLVAMNHVSIYDPPLLISFWQESPEAVAAIDIWSKRGQSSIVSLYGAIPVHRGAYDRTAIDRMVAALQAGRPVVIAPEGGRSHVPGLRRGLAGISYLADQVAAPIVPVGITGTTDDFFSHAIRGRRPELIMNIGQPFALPPIAGTGAVRRAARQRNVDQILYHVAALLPLEYRGVYADASSQAGQ